MRKDVYVSNDSGAMSLLSSAVLERVIDDGRDDDEGFVQRHEAILGSLVGDDSFIARVVAGEPLTPDEESQWIAHYRWALDVPCGRLLVCGGYDPDVLGEWLEEGGHDGVGAVEVPPGKYLVDVYTYLHSMNGRVILDQEWGTRLGEWFRRDHAGRPFPSWVAGELKMFSDEDPGHESEWREIAASVAAGTLAVETDPLDWIGFLVHLQPFDAGADLSEPEDGGGWFGAGQGLRRPERLPLGVPAVGAEDPEYRIVLSDLLEDGGQKAAAPAPPPPVDVWSRVSDEKPVEIAGGPVEVRLGDWRRLFGIAWLASAWSHPELRIEAPGVESGADRLAGVAGVRAVPGPGRLSLRFPAGGPRLLGALGRLPAEVLAVAPSGSRVTLATAQLDMTKDQALGRTKFRGVTRGEGAGAAWALDAAHPAVAADTLRSALRLTAAAESETGLVLDSPEEAARVLAAFMKGYKYLLQGFRADGGIRATCEGAEIRLTQADETIVHFLAATAFRQRYAGVWTVEPQEEDD